MANKELDQMRSILSNLDSEATSKPQPSKNMNGGSAKIDGANPTSPSTNPATRREQYKNYIKTLNKDQATKLYQTVSNYKEMGLTEDQIYDNVLGPSTVKTEIKEAPTTTGIDLTIKGNFDLYNPIDRQNQPEMMQQYYVQANNDIKSSKRALSKLILQQDALNSKSSNVEQVTTLIDAIENAYDRGVFDTQTIANTLGVPAETVSLIQQGKANELVTLNQEFVEDELKSFYRAEEDYDINLQRTMEDFNLAKTNLDRQYNSAMQTLKRNLFDDKRAASVGSAVAGISGSEYAVRVIEAKHQQNMDDLEGDYLYSSIQQKYSYTRAIEDYNKNIQRLSEDFDDSLKDIQASVLQQFQEIDNKIGLTTEQLAKAYGTLQQNVLAAKSTATTNYLEALANNENGLANAIANTYGLDQGDLTTQKFGESIRTGDTVGNDVNSIGHILNSNDGLRIGTYTNSKGYTYNVYATREDGLNATIQLLKRGYYGMSLADAAQKWIGKGKDISVAKSVILRNGLKLTDKLSDANVRKFIQAMGQWEGTLKNGKTLDEWLKEGRVLGTSPTATTTSTGGSLEAANNAANNAFITAADLAVNPNRSVSFQGQFTDNVKKYVQAGNYDGALEYILSKSVSGLGQDEKNQLNAAQNALGQLASIQIALDQYEKMGGETSLFAGLEEDVAAKIGKVKDPKLRALATQINTAIINYRKAITGAGFSETETKEYQSIFPSTKNSKALNTAIINGALDGMLTTINTKYADVIGPTTYTELLKAYESVKGTPYDFRANKQELMKYLKKEGLYTKGIGKKWTYSPTRLLTSITNPSAQAANNIFSNPGRAAPMSTMTNSALTGVYQTIMPK